VGLSAPPIETEHGWLIIYHGVRETASGAIYQQGLALFDLDAPHRCIRHGDRRVLSPGSRTSGSAMWATRSSPAGIPSGRTAIR
jgi:predicted GH43/DUF377 family glycosyl hydrolase